MVFSNCVFQQNNISRLVEVRNSSNVIIEHCKFYDNVKLVITPVDRFPIVHDGCSTEVVTAIIKNTTFYMSEILKPPSSISVRCTRLLLIGPVKFHSIMSQSIMDEFSVIKMYESAITVNGYVEFSLNVVNSLIKYECTDEECFIINIANNATLIIYNNTVGMYFVVDWRMPHSEKLYYLPCFFQYLNSGVTDYKAQNINYSILFDKNNISFYKIVAILCI